MLECTTQLIFIENHNADRHTVSYHYDKCKPVLFLVMWPLQLFFCRHYVLVSTHAILIWCHGDNTIHETKICLHTSHIALLQIHLTNTYAALMAIMLCCHTCTSQLKAMYVLQKLTHQNHALSRQAYKTGECASDDTGSVSLSLTNDWNDPHHQRWCNTTRWGAHITSLTASQPNIRCLSESKDDSGMALCHCCNPTTSSLQHKPPCAPLPQRSLTHPI